MTSDELKFALEALLFSAEKPLTVEQLEEAVRFSDRDVDAQQIESSLGALAEEYTQQSRGFGLYKIAGGYQLASSERFEQMIKNFYQGRLRKKLSGATLETLSIVAYKQPVTKAEIEFIRGVNCDAAMKVLLEKNMLKIAGRKEVPGRPILYATTEEFLYHFGMNSIADLPPLTQFNVQDIDPSLLPPEMAQDGGVSVEASKQETSQIGGQSQGLESSEESATNLDGSDKSSAA